MRYLYKVVQPAKLKATPRLLYKIGCLPMSLDSKGIGGTFDLLRLSKFMGWKEFYIKGFKFNILSIIDRLSIVKAEYLMQ